jgi:predicted nucleotidyltransferase
MEKKEDVTLLPAAFERELTDLFAAVPQLVCMEIFGSWVAGTLREHSDIDLLLVVDVPDPDALWQWEQDHLDWSAIRRLEEAVGREVHVTKFTLTQAVSEARRGSGFLTTLYARPRRALLARLEEVLPEDATALLRAKALAFIARLEARGPLDAAYTERRLELVS